jgi:flagellar protein FliS
MNAYYTAQEQYNQNAIKTASPEQLLLMLYDGAIRFIRQAIIASEQNKQTEMLGRISKAFAIIVAFSDTLNHDVGGDIAADLDGLYQFMLKELHKARNQTDQKSLKIVEGLLVDLRETWGKAVDINKKDIEASNSTNQVNTNLNISLAVAG